MEEQCVLKLALDYPKHRFDPVDLLNFVESTEFSRRWHELGLNSEEDLTSLQLCIMANPLGDMAIKGSGGLLVHCHLVDSTKKSESAITVYYAYFQEHGCAYLNYVDNNEPLEFSVQQLDEIRVSLEDVKEHLNRLRKAS